MNKLKLTIGQIVWSSVYGYGKVKMAERTMYSSKMTYWVSFDNEKHKMVSRLYDVHGKCHEDNVQTLFEQKMVLISEDEYGKMLYTISEQRALLNRGLTTIKSKA